MSTPRIPKNMTTSSHVVLVPDANSWSPLPAMSTIAKIHPRRQATQASKITRTRAAPAPSEEFEAPSRAWNALTPRGIGYLRGALDSGRNPARDRRPYAAGFAAGAALHGAHGDAVRV